jgi:lipopolysaccharide/colanic/teichoic acid biosynthesis glycosyltransferase
MKRLLDFGIALIGCAILTPVFLALAILVARESPGGAIYRQERIGKNGRPFFLLKFRSMRANIPGPEITLGNSDPRITRTGQWLRKTKLDELPQLWNVVKGDMSLVGPRPEVAKYVALYTPKQRDVLNVRPGLTDPASIDAFDEGARLETAEDPETYYREVILPKKVNLQLAYLSTANVLTDGWVIVRTLLRILQ